MKKMPQLDTMDQMVEATTAAMAEGAAGSAFHLFSDKRFALLANLALIGREESDRIFNEILVAHLVLLMFSLEAPDLRVDDDLRPFLATLSKNIPRAHVASLKNLGVEDEHQRLWDQLIAMRYEEYVRDRHDVRATTMRAEAAEKELDVAGLAKITWGLPVQTVAIGCHRHVCRGEMEGRMALFKLTLETLGQFYLEFRMQMEGGKITPIDRARIAVRRAIRRVHKKKKR